MRVVEKHDAGHDPAFRKRRSARSAGLARLSSIRAGCRWRCATPELTPRTR